MSSFKHLHSATMSTSVDAAMQSLENYFKEDKFASKATADSGTSSELSQEERLARAQVEAVRLLSESEEGLRRLHSLLTHPKLFNVFELIARHPFSFPWDAYGDVRAALKTMRGHEGRKNANKADAYNVTFANKLNNHLAQRVREGKLKAPFFFRLLTNTRTIHRLTGEPNLSINFRVEVAQTGHTLDLLDGTEDATAKRILRKLRTGEQLKEVIDFGVRRDRAAAALGYIVEEAFNKKQSVDDLIGRMQNIQNKSDLAIGIELHKYIKDLDAFFRPDYDFVSRLIESRVRKDLLPDRSVDRRGAQTPAASDLLLLENLVTSTQRVLTEIDTLGFELTAIQGDDSKSWMSPIMSLEKIDYKTEVSSSRGVESWQVTHGRSKRIVFSADRLASGWSMYWPTQVSGTAALALLLTELKKNIEPLDVVTLYLIDFRGSERKHSVAFGAISVTDEDLADVAFIRLEMGHLIFVSELFSPVMGYTLITGIIMVDRIPDLDLLNRIFGILGREGRNSLFCRLLNVELYQWVRNFLT